MNILMTGCAGFIGNVAWRRLEKKYKLIGIDNLSRETAVAPVLDSIQHHLFYVEDINDIEKVNLPKLDAIIHLAAQVSVTQSVIDPIDDIRTNAEGTLRMCMLAKEHDCKLIYASTNKVYGELEGVAEPISDDRGFTPETAYGISKCTGAQYVLDMLPDTGYVFHQSCIYGETQVGTVDQGWVGWLRNSIDTKRPVVCFGDGTQVRDLLHVEDLVDLYEMVLDGKIEPGSYVTGGGVENAHSFCEVMDLLGGEIDSYDDWRPHDQRYFVSSNEKLNASGWKPKVLFSQWIKEQVHAEC
jgi:CDP-paratose 2-epimerase